MGHPHKVENPWIAAFAVLIGFVLGASGANAATNPQQSQERTARKACLSGDYEKGVSILSDLFVDTKDTTYIFNQARCFEQNRRYEDAIARFQEYLRAAPDLAAADKALTEKHIADCQEILARQLGRSTASPAPVAVEPAVVPPPPAPPAPVVPPAPAADVSKPSTPAPSGGGSGLRAAGIATASVGVVALVAGVALNLKVNSMASDLETLGNYSDGKESQRKTYQTLGWIGYGAGAACIATGTLLYVLGLRSSNTTTLAIVPVLTSEQTGAAVGGRF